MTSITYVGLDVHTTNYTAACYRFETENTFAVAELKPKADEIEKYLKRVKKELGRGLRVSVRLRSRMSRIQSLSRADSKRNQVRHHGAEHDRIRACEQNQDR